LGSTPASVTIMPEKEWPTSTVGPSCRSSARCAAATLSSSVVSGFCTEVAFSPAACSRRITADQHEPSAKRPWTSTTLRAFGTDAAAGGPIELAAEAAAKAATNARRSMRTLPLSHRASGLQIRA
jgi:hypothetical protein